MCTITNLKTNSSRPWMQLRPSTSDDVSFRKNWTFVNVFLLRKRGKYMHVHIHMYKKELLANANQLSSVRDWFSGYQLVAGKLSTCLWPASCGLSKAITLPNVRHGDRPTCSFQGSYFRRLEVMSDCLLPIGTRIFDYLYGDGFPCWVNEEFWNVSGLLAWALREGEQSGGY